jgi:hypothetical protein
MVLVDSQGDPAKAAGVRQIEASLKNDSRMVQLRNLIFIATEGRPQEPFGCLEELDDLVEPLVAVNVSFQHGIEEWMDQIYEVAVMVDET